MKQLCSLKSPSSDCHTLSWTTINTYMLSFQIFLLFKRLFFQSYRIGCEICILKNMLKASVFPAYSLINSHSWTLDLDVIIMLAFFYRYPDGWNMNGNILVFLGIDNICLNEKLQFSTYLDQNCAEPWIQIHHVCHQYLQLLSEPPLDYKRLY